MWALTITLALLGKLVLADLTTDNTYVITPIKNTPGLYYEQLSSLQLQQADWRVTVFIDTDRFAKDFPTDESLLYQVYEACSKINTRGACRELLLLDWYVARLRTARTLRDELYIASGANSIGNNKQPAFLRSLVRRSVPLGFVGSLSKSLFGTLTQEDAEYLNQQIDRLYSTHNNLTHLVEKQMHLTRSKFQELHAEHLDSAVRVNRLFHYVDELHKGMDAENNKTALLLYNSTLSIYASRVEDKIDRYIEACEHYLKAITSAREGILEPSTLNTAQLLTIAKEAQLKAPGYQFPFPLEELRPEAIAKVSRTDLVYHEGRLMIVIHIPLLDHAVYQLYRMHPWPVAQEIFNQTGAAHIAPATPYLALSRDQRKYFLMEEASINTCKLVDHRRICSTSEAIAEVATSDNCEIQMLVNPSMEVFRRCDVRIHQRRQPYWTHLPIQGGWLYSLSQPEVISITCPGLPLAKITLEGAGVLHLSPNCVGRTRSITLTGIRTYESTERIIYQPAIALNLSLITPVFPQLQGPKLSHLDLMEYQPDDSRLWRASKGEESLLDIEAKIHAIGHQKREEQQQRYINTAVLAGQGCMLASILLYLCRAQLLKAVLWSFTVLRKQCVRSRPTTACPEAGNTTCENTRSQGPLNSSLTTTIYSEVEPKSGRSSSSQPLPRQDVILA